MTCNIRMNIIFKLTMISLEIKSVTWSKVSHGLFDYESSSFAIKKAHIQKTSHIYRKGCLLIIIQLWIEITIILLIYKKTKLQSKKLCYTLKSMQHF